MSMAPPAAFMDLMSRLGIELEPGELERLGAYLALLLETNRRFNLTAVTDPDQAWVRHIGDSLALVPYLASGHATSAVDIGSGGGLPGLPVAIVLPGVQFTLVEATGKKAAFLADAARALGLGNVTVVNERAEAIGQDYKHHRERYDMAIARAVGRLPVLLELALPLVKVGGHVLAIKGEKAAAEIEEAKQALHLLHAEVADVVRGETGTIVVIQKRRTTPRAYPRRPGEPKRAPLGVKQA